MTVSAEALEAVRRAAGPARPAVVRWAPQARDALLWPVLATLALETPEQARRREFHELLMRGYVQAALVLTPHASMGNVVPAGGAQQPTGTVSGPTPPAPGT